MDFRRQPRIKRVTAKKTAPVESVKKQVVEAQQIDRGSRVYQSNKLISSSESSALKLAQRFQARSLSERVDDAEKLVVDHTRKHVFGRIANLQIVRKIVFMWLFLMGSLLFAVGFSQYFNQTRYKDEVFVGGGTYSEGIVGDIDSLNPLFAASEPERAFSKLAFSRLFTVDTSGELKGDLVKKFSADEKYKKYTFEITKNAKWSDGKTLTVDDVIFTVNLLSTEAVNPGSFESWKKVAINKKDDFNFEFDLTNESRSFLYSLDFAILPKHKLEKVAVNNLREDKFSENPITSGPFKMRTLQRVKDQKAIFLTANKQYYAGAPKLDRFEIRAYQDEAALKTSLKSGEVLAASNIDLKDFSKAEKVAFSENKTNLKRGIFAFMNQSNAILKEAKVRKAIQQGVDMAKIRQDLDGMKALDYPILDEYFDTLKINKPQYNQAAAEKLLDDDGWKVQDGGIRQKGEQRLAIDIVTIKNTNFEAIAKSFSSQLKELGFEINLRVIDPSDKSQNFVQMVLQPREYGILIYEINLGIDPELYTFWHSSQRGRDGFNLAEYSDGVSDDNVVSSMNRTNDALRQAKYESFVGRWLDNVPAIGVVQSRSLYTYKNSIKTYSRDNEFVENTNRYADVLYWQVNKGSVYKTP